ncbi:MAG: DUF5916 domain-containing protein [Bacteroidales bacterium]
MKRFIIPLIFLFSVITGHALAQSRNSTEDPVPLRVIRITEEIILDGIPDEEIWQSVEPLPMVMFTPDLGKEPTDPSVVRIAYDDEYFYVSAWLDCQDPDDIRAISKKRDYSSPSTDYLGFIMDTFNDRENAVSFHTNPNGLRTDGTVKNDALDPTEDLSFSWNTFWDVNTALSEKGWSAEFRIPFSSLRFQSQKGKTVMGLSIMRYSAAKYECSTWPVSSPEFPAPYWKPSLCAPVEFEGLEPRSPVYIAPYVTAGIGQENELNEAGTGYTMYSTPKYDAGLDVKYSLTPNLTADLTINTDFAQVEADDQKINLTRYSLYFPEKRIFFLEKADVFDFSFLGGNNLFYSRRIGLYEGNPVRIYGGLRMTGRVGKWDIGVLDMQTAPFKENPSENFGVLRTKRKVLNEYSYVGGMVTSRIGTNGNYNTAYGLDGLFRVTGDEYLTVKWAQTFESDSANRLMDMAPTRFLIEWQRRGLNGFTYDFVYTWSGKKFNPGVGFEVKENYHGPRVILRYGWLPESDKVLRQHSISLTGYNFMNTLTNLHETTIGMLQWTFEAKKGYSGNIAANWYLENIREDLTLGNDQATVPPGRYSFAYLSASYFTAYMNAFSAYFTSEAGMFYDGWKFTLTANPMLKIGAGLDLGLSYRIDRVDFSSRSVAFTNHIAGFRGEMTLTTKISLSAFVQYNTAINKVISNVRFRYNPREGNDFYVVYDDTQNTRLTREFPVLPHTDNRTILLKYTHTFRW